MSAYTITNQDSVTTMTGGTSDRVHFIANGREYIASRTTKVTDGVDETMIFPSRDGEIDLATVLFGSEEPGKYTDVTHEEAIEKFLSER